MKTNTQKVHQKITYWLQRKIKILGGTNLGDVDPRLKFKNNLDIGATSKISMQDLLMMSSWLQNHRPHPTFFLDSTITIISQQVLPISKVQCPLSSATELLVPNTKPLATLLESQSNEFAKIWEQHGKVAMERGSWQTIWPCHLRQWMNWWWQGLVAQLIGGEIINFARAN